jgi:hypothetical protein
MSNLLRVTMLLQILACSSAFTEDASPEPPPPAATHVSPDIELKLSPRKPSLLDNIKFDITISHTDPKIMISLAKVEIATGNDDVISYQDEQNETDKYIASLIASEKFHKEFKYVDKSDSASNRIWSALFSVPPKATVNIVATYDVYGMPNGEPIEHSQRSSKSFDIAFEAPFWAPLLGIPIGTALLALYFLVNASMTFNVVAKLWLGLTIMGIFVFIISKGSADIQFPIHVDTTNFVGGVILGLFTVAFKNWFEKYIK